MPRNLFSRLVPSTGDDLPWYEQRSRDPGSEPDQDRLGLLDEENLTHQFQDDDLERAQGLNLEDSQTSTQIPDARQNLLLAGPRNGYHPTMKPILITMFPPLS